MKPLFILPWLAAVIAGAASYLLAPMQQEVPVPAITAADTHRQAPAAVIREEPSPGRTVLDIPVHTLDELRVLLDRAEQLASRLPEAPAGASVVLVLRGPEVECFPSKNYGKYRDVVEQAARLDASEIVDVKICRTMMNIRGVARDDIPAFIDQVKGGHIEVERLRYEGYVCFWEPVPVIIVPLRRRETGPFPRSLSSDRTCGSPRSIETPFPISRLPRCVQIIRTGAWRRRFYSASARMI